MLTCDELATGRRYDVLAIDGENGDPLIRRDGGQIIRAPRYLVTTPTERCDQCGKPLEFRNAQRKNGDIATCPDAEHHMYAMYWRQAYDTGLNRKVRRRMSDKANKWLSKHLEVKRGRSNRLSATDVGSTS